MADPFRLAVLKALTQCLEGISTMGGYANDLDGKVFRGRRMFGEDDPLPLIAINDFPLQEDQIPTPKGGTARETTWQLLIQGFVEDDYQNPSDPAHVLAADLQQALALESKKNDDRNPDILGMGPRITDIKIGLPIVNAPDEISSKAYCFFPLTLTIVEDLENPYPEA